MNSSLTLKALAVAVAFAAGTAPAAAQTTFFNHTTGNSSMILAVWDDVRDVSYVRDLGIRYNDFLPTVQPLRSFATSAMFGETFLGQGTGPVWSVASNLANLQWAVFGGETVAPANIALTRALTSPLPAVGGATNTLIGNTLGAAFGIINQGRLLDVNATSFRSGPDRNGIEHSVNDERLLGAQTLFGVYAGSIGENMAFVNYLGSITVTPAAQPRPVFYNAFMRLDGDGTLHYVPVPAAVWLLGSALVGMAGVARRRAA
ncbi:MAG TPA: hypothetical protein DCY89_04580 [Gammaproteobacteria bacterium]|nr:hypothetical protein [Gammaproteobacteria bacterium]